MKYDGTPENSSGDKSAGKLEEEDVLALMRERFRVAIKATANTHRDGLHDLKFLRGDGQWPEKQRRQREAEGRPCLTINKLPTFLQQVTNDQRQNKASIKVSQASEEGDIKVAEIIQGMVRHIEYDSSADSAYDTALNSAATIGFGYYRFVTEYESDASFNQIIRIKRIRNPFTVYFDPSSVEIDGSDAEWVIITSKMTKIAFKAKYPSAVATSQMFDTIRSGDDTNKDWLEGDDIRIAEYYFKHYEDMKLYLLPDGRSVEKLAPGEEAVRARIVRKCRILHWFCTPCEVLQKSEILAPGIPVFPVYGSEIDLDGEVYRSGLVRNAKDPAIMYNFWMTSATEEIAMRPKTPYIGAKGQFKGEEKRWQQANVRSYAYLEYEPVTVDGQVVPAPSRQQPADVPHGFLTMAMHASDNIKATTGIYDSSLGNNSHATSGKQEVALQKQGSVANYHFVDNFFKTLRWSGKVLLAMIPNYYDAERMVMVRGEDMEVQGVKINEYDAAAQRYKNDIRVGKYEAVVTVGPSYASMRAEAQDAMVQFGQSWPKLMDLAGDKVVKAMNWPGAEDIAERIKRAIPKEVLGPKDLEEGEQMPLPPEVQQELAQMKQLIEELQGEADANHAKVTAEQIRKEAIIEAAHIGAESRKDVEEIKGWVKMLVEQMQPPALLDSEVVEGAANKDTKAISSEEAPGQSEDMG